MPDPRYVNVDEDGNEAQTGKLPKWKIPSTPWQRELLAIFHPRKYFASREEHDFFHQVEKGMMPLATNYANPPAYPTEWVNELLEWARKERAKNPYWPIRPLIFALQNKERRQEWINEQVTKHLKEKTQPLNTVRKLDTHGITETEDFPD